ncbi:MAG: UDP-N-acetylmuramoyl-L-alanyl-D-glutamate--2,6-diaminopimelate ligase, partial [Nitrospirae bacterium]|nr:UDP-N-acetylmuramoyl-L-alanyl-D-glutamate--2,6-diaminopimelate ligase [Nitrospirota bacterium]
MTLKSLIKGIKVAKVTGDVNCEIKGIAYDSRNVKERFLFVAVRGFSTDGHRYINDALSRGAAGVIVEKEADLSGICLSCDGAAFATVEDSRDALAAVSSAFYREPSKGLSLIGITGTNGKTTTSYITKSILDTWGRKVGLLGTIRYIIGNRVAAAIHTTPESLDLQGYLREMLDNNVEYAVLEVSSHALTLKRVEGCSFKAAAFTNFTQDHLDFHGTMEEYFTAKAKIFDYVENGGYAVLNWDDPAVRTLTEKLKCNVITCGLQEGAMIRGMNIDKAEGRRKKDEKSFFHNSTLIIQPSDFIIQTPGGELNISSPLAGRNNVYNILMSVGIAYALGVGDEAIIKGLGEVSPVEGRFEKIDAGQKFLCILDYAHTEDALKRLIEEARLITKGKVITVFGCGGNRDRDKRHKMGAVAAELSDFVIITSDNPRTENPMWIINDIIAGIKKSNYMILPDRAEAIIRAVSMTEQGDTLLVAGKGHEDYQEINGIRRPFSDR